MQQRDKEVKNVKEGLNMIEDEMRWSYIYLIEALDPEGG